MDPSPNNPNEPDHSHPYLELASRMFFDPELQELIHRPQFMYDIACALDGIRSFSMQVPSSFWCAAITALVLSAQRQNYEANQTAQSTLTEEERTRSAKLLEEVFRATEFHEDAPEADEESPEADR